MRWRAVTVLPLLVIALLGCKSTRDGGLAVDRIDDRGPQTKAVIQLSDPQIYSRETLINDRRDEADYLRALLESSNEVTFEPEIHRSLRLLSSTTARLSASFDPLGGTLAERQDQLASLQHRTELVRAQAELLEAQRALEELSEGDSQPLRVVRAAETSGGGDGEAAADTADGDEAADGSDGAAAAGAEGRAILEQIAASVDRLLATLEKMPDAGAPAGTASPRDELRDRQAYRGELRAALAEVELDDSHDRGQNSLYRLQFRATVAPGDEEGKYGVARLTLRPPVLSESDVVELYKTWLAHVTSRLNQTESGVVVADPSYLLLGTGIGERALFQIFELPLDGVASVRLAIPPKVGSILASYRKRFKTSAELRAFASRLHAAAEALGKIAPDQLLRLDRAGDAVCKPVGCPCTIGETGLTQEEVFYMADDLYWVHTYVSTSLRGLGATDALSAEQRRAFDDLMFGTSELASAVDRLVALWKQDERNAACFDEEDPFDRVPESFREALALKELVSRSQRRFLARGESFVYTTSPAELAQRVSTAASATRSVEMALALAASLPTSGIGADVGLGHLRASQNEIAALERNPLVVGFADRRRPSDGETAALPELGWIFGPRARIDGTKMRWLQPVTSYIVAADLSVPGWWPWVELTQETAWVGNRWRNGELLRAATENGNARAARAAMPADEVQADRFRVHLPLNRADLDGLTEYLAQRTAGGTLPFTKITAVSPNEIASCQEKVTFLVHGANVWRGTDAYLNGMRHSELRILPDMAGLAVTFDGLRDLPRRNGSDQSALLTVWSRDGAASRTVTVADGRTRGMACGGAGSSSLRLALATSRLVGHAGQVKVAAPDANIPKRFHHLGVQVRPAEVAAPWSRLEQRTAERQPGGGWVTGWVELDGGDATSLREGDLLEAVLVEYPAPHELPTYHPVTGRIVFYPDIGAASAHLLDRELTTLQNPVKIRLPRRYDLAYPTLRQATLTGSISGKPTAKVQAVALRWPDSEKAAPVLEVLLDPGNAKLEPGDIIRLELRGSGELPALVGEPVKIAGGGS